MPRRLLLLVASTLVLLGGCATPAPVSEGNPRGSYQHTEKYLSWLVDREMAENEITGLSIALVDDQQVIWQKGFGYADLETGSRRHRKPFTGPAVGKRDLIENSGRAAASG